MHSALFKTYIFQLDFTLKNVCNVNLANFNGEYIKINAKENVHIDKCQAENISILTMHGNILSKNALQAAKIKLEALNGVRIMLLLKYLRLFN